MSSVNLRSWAHQKVFRGNLSLKPIFVGEGGFSSLFTLLLERWFRRSLLIGIGIALCMAAEAGGVIMYYGTLILKETNGNDMQLALLGNTGNGVLF